MPPTAVPIPGRNEPAAAPTPAPTNVLLKRLLPIPASRIAFTSPIMSLKFFALIPALSKASTTPPITSLAVPMADTMASPKATMPSLLSFMNCTMVFRPSTISGISSLEIGSRAAPIAVFSWPSSICIFCHSSHVSWASWGFNSPVVLIPREIVMRSL